MSSNVHSGHDLARGEGKAAPGEQEELKLHLGLPPKLVEPLVRPGTPARRVVETFATLGEPVDVVLEWLIAKTPTKVKHVLLKSHFKALVVLYKALPEKIAQRGLSGSLSVEAHALSSLMWWTRLMPMTLRRFRVGLSLLSFADLPTPGVQLERVSLPDQGVSGIYLHTAPRFAEDPPVLVFFFGGAFFGGSAADNCGFVERYARQLKCDAFIADYSLCPESRIEDAFRDGCRTYEWILSRKAPEKVVLMGNSSGGGVCLRVLQLANAPEADRLKFFQRSGPVPQPAGAVLLGPFVNYTIELGVDDGNSQIRHQMLDNQVTERVFEFLQPQMAAACGGKEGKRATSPLFQDMRGLCPTLVSFSSHEICTDDNRALVEKLREAGNDVACSELPYLCHSFHVYAAFLPEGAQEELRTCDWIKQRGSAWGA